MDIINSGNLESAEFVLQLILGYAGSSSTSFPAQVSLSRVLLRNAVSYFLSLPKIPRSVQYFWESVADRLQQPSHSPLIDIEITKPLLEWISSNPTHFLTGRSLLTTALVEGGKIAIPIVRCALMQLGVRCLSSVGGNVLSNNRAILDSIKEESTAEESLPQESPQQESPQQESPQQESPQQESPQQESPQQESPQQESPQQESPQQESLQQESPHQGPPKDTIAGARIVPIIMRPIITRSMTPESSQEEKNVNNGLKNRDNGSSQSKVNNKNTNKRAIVHPIELRGRRKQAKVSPALNNVINGIVSIDSSSGSSIEHSSSTYFKENVVPDQPLVNKSNS